MADRHDPDGCPTCFWHLVVYGESVFTADGEHVEPTFGTEEEARAAARREEAFFRDVHVPAVAEMVTAEFDRVLAEHFGEPVKTALAPRSVGANVPGPDAAPFQLRRFGGPEVSP